MFCLGWIALACVGFACRYNVLDVESYFLPAIVALTVLGALGLDRWGTFRGAPVALSLSVLILFVGNVRAVDLHGNRFAQTYADDLLLSTPPGAVLMTFGDSATHLLAYRQGAAHERNDVTIVSVDEISDWYVEQLRAQHTIEVPSADDSQAWLAELIRRNVTTHPICLTQPISFLPPLVPLPHGLVFCLAEHASPSDVAAALELGRRIVDPEPALASGAAIQVQMAAYSYALARFQLVRLLLEANDVGDARAQAAVLVAMKPDELEAQIAEGLRAVDRERSQSFALGSRSAQVLQSPAAEAGALLSILNGS